MRDQEEYIIAGSNNSINAAGTSELPESSDPGGSHGVNKTTRILRAPTK